MNNFRGSAIVIALLAVSALMTVVLSIARLVPKDYRSALAFESSLNAENAAWAGVEHGLLLLRQHPYYELSAEMQRNPSDYPHGIYPAPPNQSEGDCDVDRTLPVCKGFDRQLGVPVNATPAKIGSLLGAHSTENYSLAIWHRREDVGNMRSNGSDPLDDNLSPLQNQSLNAPNINPTLRKDEEKTLDIKGDTSISVRWKLFSTGGDCSNSTSSLVYTLKDDKGDVITSVGTDQARGVQGWNRNSASQILPINQTSGAATLTLRFLTDTDSCFIRYTIANLVSGQTADLGFDVIDSVGESGGVRRKIRVLVDRHNGKVLNIFDFGVACDSCSL